MDYVLCYRGLELCLIDDNDVDRGYYLDECKSTSNNAFCSIMVPPHGLARTTLYNFINFGSNLFISYLGGSLIEEVLLAP